ncbi:MAG: SH3 domain-containing protein [Desulfovibrionaceae bacterium]|nr:SH3 domain-containing protein [Desulfovibrionaceae bacterium]
MLSKKIFYIGLLLVLLQLVACAHKTPKPQQVTLPKASIADEVTFPQDLNFYAKQAGLKKNILTPAQQQQAKRHFNSIFFGPWDMEHGLVKASDACIRRARGYKLTGQRWTQPEWDEIVANANLSQYPCMGLGAITIRNTDLREIPTHEARYSKTGITPKEFPFDDFQYSQLPIGMPLFLSHKSKDGRWYFAESPWVGGWIDANDVALTDEAFEQSYTSFPLAAIIQDQVPLPGVGTPGTIGTVLPLISKNNTQVKLYIPVRNDHGLAALKEIVLPSKAAAPHPLPFTPANAAKLGNQLLGQHYGWGGMYGLRDCSATTHDLLAPFGIWLPRNSRAQAHKGIVIDLKGLPAEAKEDLVKAQGVPFLSLVGLPGHITMYVGTYKDRPAILHNMWGVRTIEGSDNNARHVVGKTVITSLKPGFELPDLYRERTFIDNVRSLSTPIPPP